jgi:RNA polymerase sigma factor (sigma-70 family)
MPERFGQWRANKGMVAAPNKPALEHEPLDPQLEQEIASMDLIQDVEHGIFKHRRKPGPPGASAPKAPELDLADAALILELIDSKTLRTDSPPDIFTLPKGHLGAQASRLSADDEAELARRVQIWGDVDARNALVMANIGLVHLVAGQFCRPPLRYEDLLQEGSIGLIRATETFEPNRNVRFSTYSVYWIRAKIQRLIQRLEKDDVPGISGAEPSVDVEGHKRKPRARKLSLERTAEDSDARGLGEILPAATDDPEEMALKLEKARNVKEVLNDIVEELDDPRLTEIIKGRLLADEPETLSAIGQRLHLSREGTRLLESKMLKLARERLEQWRHSK